MAGGLVSQGERGLESLKTLSLSMSKGGAVGKVLERLADPGLEKRILDGIEGLDTDEVIREEKDNDSVVFVIMLCFFLSLSLARSVAYLCCLSSRLVLVSFLW